MRTVYLGTTDFAAAVLERLAATAHRPELVVTRPDRPRGRGRKVSPPPVAETARRLDIALDQPQSVNADDARERIAAADPEVVCICAFGALIREPLLSDHEMLNVHPSLLPRWRGAAPIERAIEAGDDVTGVSIMRPVAEMDAGPVCMAAEERIEAEDDYGTLSRRLRVLAGELLVQALDSRPPFREQSESGVTLADKITAEDRRLDPERSPAPALERRVRALHPHIGAWLELPGGERLGVRRTLARLGEADPGLPPGQVAVREGRLLVGTGDGALELLEVQPPGGTHMSAADYLRGHARQLATEP